jgi:RNA polymerase sigma factor (sigma-70 family)
MTRPRLDGEPGEADVLDSPGFDATLRFETFYVQEIARLVALAAGLCGRASAEDVAQEAMLVTYRRWHEVRDRDHPEAFARRVCANLAVSVFRRRMVELRALMRLSDRAWSKPASPPGEEQAFWAEVAALPKRQAQAIALRYIYELDVADIAATLGVTAGSVKVHLYRGRQALAARLGTDAEEQP